MWDEMKIEAIDRKDGLGKITIYGCEDKEDFMVFQLVKLAYTFRPRTMDCTGK